jgi:hypothetical protein
MSKRTPLHTTINTQLKIETQKLALDFGKDLNDLIEEGMRLILKLKPLVGDSNVDFEDLTNEINALIDNYVKEKVKG